MKFALKASKGARTKPSAGGSGPCTAGSGLALSFFERRLGGFEPELYFYLSTGKTPVARGRGKW
ncbi:hypothetical protein CLOLEP_03588 [[Clostridium] leptum DSM 753]|uniref:Uncharacterized protein n=1 Tax=[Clostridium] leptum DSM 753 TaxID=428125 RepID=A7VYB0_9FIRM|nr:hypothetical protein CLOLEP_03588 [[Clostridium] leptum DSM 753]